MKRRQIVLLPFALSAFIVLASVTAFAVHVHGLFELGPDGGTTDIQPDTGIPGPDWADLFFTNISGDVVDKDVAPANGIPDYKDYGGLDAKFLKDDLAVGKLTDATVFTTASKNNDPISSLEWGDGNAPAKDDLSNAYVYATLDDSFNPDPPHLILYVGLERIAPNGDSHIDIELNQQFIDTKAGTNKFTGDRTPGDILVVMDFEVGGSLGYFELWEWDGTQFQQQGSTSTGEGCNAADTACAFNNHSSIPKGDWASYPYEDNHGNPITTLEANAFTEVGVDVSALIGHEICLSTIQIKSRTSQSFTGQLKDFVIGHLDICSKINVIKDAAPKDGTDFGYTAVFPNTSTIDFTLDDDDDPTFPNTTTIRDLLPGHYAVNEHMPLPDDWKFVNVTCFGLPPGRIITDIGSASAGLDLGFGEEATCVFTNILPAKIRILKETDPDEYDQDFDFVFSNGTTIPFTLNDSGSDIREFDQLMPGTYTVTETEPAGWNLADLNCVIFGDATTVESGATSTITVGPGSEVECTYTNRTRSSITIVKDSIPNNQGFFNYSGDLGTNGTFGLAGDTFINFTGLLPGTYEVKELLPEGWRFTNLTCVETGIANSTHSGTTSTIVLDPGENVTCTYTNTGLGSITVVKQAIPEGPRFFNFSGVGFGNFSTADTGFGNNSSIFMNLTSGTYTFYELVPDGWQLINITNNDSGTTGSVDKATGRTTVELEPGEDVTCTYTDRQTGSITIIKDSVPDSMGFFNYTTTGLGGFGLAGDTQTTFTNLTTGSYSVTELVPPGWIFTNLTCVETATANSSHVGATSNIVLEPGENVTCTYTNVALGKIIIAKDSDPDATGFFNYSGDLGVGGTFGLAGDTFINFTALVPGPYSVKEILPEGWAFTNLTCVETAAANSSHVGMTSNIMLDPGETVTCTYSNVKLGSIIVVKQADPQGSTFFNFSGAAPFGNFSTADTGFGNNSSIYINLMPGTYTFYELVPDGWDLVDISTDDSGTIGSVDKSTGRTTVELDSGETVTCTYNDRQRGSITIVKDSLPDSTGFFNYTTTGLGGFGLAGDTQTTFTNLTTGSYSVTELVPPGWIFTNLTCVESATVNSSHVGATSNIVLDPGENVTCTYTNVKLGKIIIAKDSDPDSSGFFNYSGDLGAGGTFGLAGDTFTNFTALLPGLYSVKEIVPEGWKFTNLSCVETASANSSHVGTTSNIVLDPGETVTCTYFNEQLGKIIIVKNSIPDSSGFFNYSGDLGTNGTFGLAGDTQTQFDDLDAGSYSVKELVPEGWMFTNLTCVETATANSSHAGTTSNIQLDPGETVTCTYTNTELGSIRVVKEAVPQTADAFDYDSTGGLIPSSFSLVDNGGINYIDFTGLAPGVYTITEQTPLPTDYYLANVTFSGDNGNSSWASATATVVVDPGEDIVVTFYNVVPAEGCTPGYWKNHLDMWPEPYVAEGAGATLFRDVFGMDPCIPGGTDMTLLEALQLQGGGKKALTRHAAAAFLNAATPEIDSYTTDWVVSMYQAACADPSLVNGTLQAFVDVNESCCPCNNTSCDNECQPPTL